MSKNFAIIGVGGYISPRHLKAIKETGMVCPESGLRYQLTTDHGSPNSTLLHCLGVCRAL